MFYNWILLQTIIYQSLSQNPLCSIMNESQTNIHFYNSENQLIILSNDENFENITNIGYELINESFRLSFNEDITIISILRFNKNFKIKREEKYLILKRLCILAKLNQNTNTSNIYMIGCTLIDFQQSTKQFNFNFNEIERIQIEQEKNVLCQNIFETSQEKIILFCYNDFYFKLIEIDAKFKISKTITHNITQEQKNCQIKILEFSDYWILSFLRCKQWIVYKINENLEVNVQLDQKFQNQQSEFQITNNNLINVQVCQKRIFYIFQNGYTYQFKIRSQDLLVFVGNNTINKNDDENLEYLVFQRCSFQYPIVSIGDQIYITDSDQKYYLGTSQIKLSQQNGILIIISEEQLTLLVSKNIKYIYNLNQTKIDQIKLQISESEQTQKIFYEINNSAKLIRILKLQFKSYVYSDYSYNFFYVISYSNILKNIQCQKIEIVSDQTNLNNDTKFTTQLKIYNHSAEQHLKFEKYDKVFQHQYDIKRQQFIEQNLKLKITVYDKFEIKEKCHSRFLNEKNFELLYIQQFSIFLILQKQTLFWVNCVDNELLNQVDIFNQEVLTTKGFIILIGAKIQDIKVINLNKIYFPFKIQNFDGVVDKIDIFSQYLLIYIKYIDIPLILNLNSLIQPDYQPSYMEDELYLNQIVKFYHCDLNILFIQYEEQYLIKKEDETLISQLNNVTIFYIFKDYKVHLAFGVHDQLEMIKLYFISDFELIEIYNFFIDEYVLIRPIKYQIKNKIIILLVKKVQNYHLLILSFNFNDLQLITNIKSTRQQFFAFDDYLIYYNSEDIIEIFDFQAFHIKLNFLQNNEVYFQNSIQFEFNIQSNYQLKGIIECNVDISILFLEFSIRTLNQFLNLNYEQTINKSNKNFKIPINPNEHFQGQIKQYELFNHQMQIFGPIINDFTLTVCRFRKYNICMESRNLIIQNRQVQIREVIENNITINVFSNSKQSAVFKLFDDYYLIILKELDLQLGLIILYNSTSKNYIQTQELFLYNLINKSMSTIEVIKKQSIYLILQENQLKTMLFFNATNFIQILLPENILDVCYIQSSKDMYLFLYYSLNLTLEFQIQQITNLEIIFSKEINQSQIIQNSIFFSNQEFYQFIKFYKLISCTQKDHVLSIIFIQFTTYYTQIIELTINTQSLEYNFVFQKKLRIFAHEQMINYILLDYNFFGIQVDGSVAYYNLSKNQEFYDSLFLTTNQIKNIYQYNSTHYYCITKDNQYLGRIGFELWFTLSNETYITNKLIAINDVSKASIDIFFTKIQNQSIDNNTSWEFQITVLLISLIIIIIFLFTLRRKKLLRNSKLPKISQ